MKSIVLVTFNRLELLKKAIDGILSQSIDFDRLYIVDNASSDGTKEYLLNAFAKNDKVKLILLDKNTGGAGGFHTGVKAAYEDGAEWIWMMDDDVVPRENCLETLLSYKEKSKCIHPRKQHLDGSYFNWYGYFDSKSLRLKSLDEEVHFKETDILKVNYGCFEGMLIHRDIVSKIGFPNKDYFICYDDRAYGWKASKFTDVVYLKNAVMDKLIKKGNTISDFSLYYLVRNFFILFHDMNGYKPKLINSSFYRYFIIFCFKRWIESKNRKGTLNIIIKSIKDGINYKRL